MTRILYKLLPAAFLLCITCCKSGPKQPDALKKNEEGLVYMNAGNYELALKAFEEAITDPAISQASKGTIFRNLALTYNELDNRDSSVHYSTLAAKCFPRNSYDYLVNMADVDLATGKISKALSRLLTAAAIYPDEMSVNNALGLIYMGEYDDAFTDLEKALTYNKKAFELSGDRVTEDVLGRNYYYMEDYDNAEYHYDRLLENHPSIITYPYYAGMVKYKLKKTAEANALFEKTVAMDSAYKEYINDFKAGNIEK
jgi:tetratricopeptide (TPR) repeat protein